MRSLVFEGNTWLAYEKMREQDIKLHKSLCRILEELLRNDPTIGIGKTEALKHNFSVFLVSANINERSINLQI